ncbi:MAG: hypothetical protein FJX61_00155 [Alphaproteobacteria bacterium]|nr:hypothetical protein [Alphaproteobacteria bacterium]
MPTRAAFATQLLRDAADFFRSVAEQNPTLADQMGESARFYDAAAGWLDEDPVAEIPTTVAAPPASAGEP